METTHYIRRSKQTFVALSIIRLIPAFLFLLIIIVLGVLKRSFTDSITSIYRENASVLLHSFNTFIFFGMLLFFIMAVLLLIDAYIEYISFTYAIDEDAFKTQTGIIDLKEMSVLYRHIQNVDVDKPLLYRLMNMSRVVILTAGHQDNQHAKDDDETEVVIDLVTNAEAQKIQQELLKRSDVEIIREAEPTPVRTS